MKPKATLFGRLIRKHRIDNGVVLKEMADSIGVSSAYVSAIELGKKNITEEFILKVFTYFQLSNSEIQELKKAASMSQPALKIDLQGVEDEDRELAVCFARKYHALSPARKQKLLKLLEG